MAELYLRKVIVNVYPQTGPAKKIEGLRVKFRIVKTSESHPNTCELSIYNLSESTRTMLEDTKSRVDVRVGYTGFPTTSISIGQQNNDGNVETVFVGNVSKSVNKNEKGGSKSKAHRYTESVIEGVDIVTKVQVADGENRFRNARISRGFPPNIDLPKIFDELATSFGLTKGSQDGIPNKKYANGLTLDGLIRDHLNVLTKGNGLQWSIQDETLQIIPKNGTTTDSIILLTPKTGLVGSPQKSDKGIIFSSLMQPQLRPGRRVKIESAFINGVFVLKKVEHDGDSHEGEFLSKCQASNISES